MPLYRVDINWKIPIETLRVSVYMCCIFILIRVNVNRTVTRKTDNYSYCYELFAGSV